MSILGRLSDYIGIKEIFFLVGVYFNLGIWRRIGNVIEYEEE